MLLSAFPSKKGMPKSSLSHVWFSFLTSKLERLCFAVGHIKYGYVTVAVLVRKNYFETSSVFLAMGQLVWGHFRPALWFIGPCCCCVCTAFSVSRCLGSFFDLASGWFTNREWGKNYLFVCHCKGDIKQGVYGSWEVQWWVDNKRKNSEGRRD